MAGDQCRSVVVQCVEVESVAISGKEEAKQAEQWVVGYIFSATELLSFDTVKSVGSWKRRCFV